MKCKHLTLLLLFASIISQDYHVRCPDLNNVLSRASIPSLDTFYITVDSTFMIHYDTTNIDNNELYDMSDNNNNHTPDYIESIGIAADSVKYILNNVMGFTEVAQDEDGIYDIYVHALQDGFWGITQSVNADGYNPSYISLRNDYSDMSQRCSNLEDLVWLTVGHEYFHAVQLEYRKLTIEPYFKEFTSMWFENIFVPNCFDFLDFISPLFNSPENNFDSQPLTNTHGYSLALYGHYLGVIIDGSDEDDQIYGSIMRRIWEEYEEGGDALEAIDDVLDEFYGGNSFIKSWADFMSRNLYCGMYEGLNNEFYYHEGQAFINPIQTNSQILDVSDSIILNLDKKSITIQSYQLAEDALLGFEHLYEDDYLGRISIIGSSNDLFWGTDTSGLEITKDSKIHFVYGSNNSNTVTIDIMYDESCGIVEGGSVWPGNTNADNIVDYNDILPVGIYWNQLTCKRTLLTDNIYEWDEQPLVNNMFLDNNCISHADANGDGTVNIADILPIMVNWDSTSTNSTDGVNIQDDNCVITEIPPSSYNNFRQIYNSIIGNSHAEIQMRHRLEELLGIASVPTIYQIHQNYPNPFNPSTSISLYLSKQSEVVLSVFDLKGRRVIKEGVKIMNEGSHEIIINGENLSSSVYFYQFTIDGNEFMPKKMVLLK